jgi:pimeloyl-ACP methyl ester carboxylesterase
MTEAVPMSAAETLAGLLRARLVRIPECGHVPYVEAPDVFAAELNAFLPQEG